jgi:hypothetical protein
MASTAVPNAITHRQEILEPSARNEANSSGVSWAAVFAGAFVAAAMSLILLSLGTGLGLSSVSPWSGVGASASAIGSAAILWLILMQFMSSSLGGYLAGRLRTKWANVHTDEVYFRDTAHGFLVWAVGLVITVTFLASAAASMMGVAAHTGSAGVSRAGGSAIASGAATEERPMDPNAYFIDTLFRSNPDPAAVNSGTVANPERVDGSTRSEAALIFANGLRQGNFPAADKSYLVNLVAAKTGVSESEADKRVSSAFVEAQQAADTARKALAHLSLWLFAALLIGAFCASFAATIGGRQRDHVQLV